MHWIRFSSSSAKDGKDGKDGKALKFRQSYIPKIPKNLALFPGKIDLRSGRILLSEQAGGFFWPSKRTREQWGRENVHEATRELEQGNWVSHFLCSSPLEATQAVAKLIDILTLVYKELCCFWIKLRVSFLNQV